MDEDDPQKTLCVIATIFIKDAFNPSFEEQMKDKIQAEKEEAEKKRLAPISPAERSNISAAEETLADLNEQQSLIEKN